MAESEQAILADAGRADDAVGALMRRTEYLKAFDLVRRAVERFPDETALRRRGVLALARMGATDSAWRLFHEWRLDGVADEETLALKARLLKDRALEGGGGVEAAALLKAAAAYEAAFSAEGGSYYSAINVAALNFLAGSSDAATAWARTARDLAESDPSYYGLATVAEAWLLLGEPDRVAPALHAAVGAPHATLEARSTTLKQLQMLAATAGHDPGFLDGLKPPVVIHYCGHMIAAQAGGRFPASEVPRVEAAIARLLNEQKVGFAVGSLAAGADILFAEAVLAAGGELDIVLPFRRQEFVDVSVRPSGVDWVARFERCLEQADDVHLVTEDDYLGHDELFNYASLQALGLARLRAQSLFADLQQMVVWDGEPARAENVAGTARDLEQGRRLGLVQHVIPSRPDVPSALPVPSTVPVLEEAKGDRLRRTMLFGDLKGFSRLGDAQLPIYVDVALGTIAQVLDRHGAHLLFRNTWGDGIFLVFDDLRAAADCAFDLQVTIAGLDREAAGLPESMGLRLGMHYGPVFEREDPILKQNNFFGFHVSRAARVEPITPEGEVYVTEPTAAALAVEAAEAFRCDYVGRIALAKNYGDLPMYALQRRSGES